MVVSDSDIVQFCTRLEQDQANKTGTMVRATKNFLKWNSGLTYGGRRNNPSQLQLVLENGPHRVAASRAAHCKRLLQRRKELETEETQLHASLDQQVGSVLKDPRTNTYFFGGSYWLRPTMLTWTWWTKFWVASNRWGL